MQARDERAMNLTARLRALPAAEPVPGGWAAVQSRLAARQRAASHRTLVVRLATAASIALVAVAGTWRVTESVHERPAALAAQLTPLTAEEALTMDRIAQLRTQSNALEQMLAVIGERPVVERAGTALPIDTLEAQVQWIDHQISMGEGSSRPGSIEALWRQRVEAMNSLVQLRYVEAQRIDM